ncbi:MAG: hypothetical protein J0I12_11230 [Candidatus Eremiobacteraeota bacterium]|nr:hypothetical protein [Candidatus Eremiobacteraeota bacterium]
MDGLSDPFFPQVSPLFPHVEHCPVCGPGPRVYPVGGGDHWAGECPRCGLLGPAAISPDAARLLWNQFAVAYNPLSYKARRLAESCAELIGEVPPDLADLYRCCQHYLMSAATNLRLRRL